jgi:hypothetical protein
MLPFSVYADDQEYLLKAAFIYKFIQVVEWPADKAVSKSSKIDICTLGDVPVGQMSSIFDKASTAALRFSVIEEKNWKNASSHCHVLFIGNSEEGRVGEIVGALKDKPVLTIGNGDEFVESGGMIGFVLRDNKIKFEVNTQSTNAAGLRVKAELLEIAAKVVR